jgi:peptidyl-prolyl cis-trans isomerase D
MLQSIREKIQGIVAAVIIGLICLTFGVWGIESYLSEASKVVVAEVGGEDIELAEYQDAFQRLRQRAQAELGDQFDPTQWAGEDTKRRVLEFVVDDELLTQLLERRRIRVGSDQVAQFLMGSPNFQVDGKFSSERYAQVTNMLGFTEQAFEQQAQRDMAVEQLRAGVIASAFASPQELDDIARLAVQTRDIGYVVLKPAEPKSVTVSDTDLKAYFKEHGESFRVPDKVALEFIEINQAELLREVDVEESDILAFYEAHKADFTMEEQRNARHILVQLAPDASDAEVASARKKAEDLRARVAKGEDFSAVARASSDDIGSRADGGSTGLFGRGVMAPEFETAVFGMKVGEISDLVRTDFGFHIITVTEIKPEDMKPYVDARGEVEQRLRKEKAEELYFELAERFSDSVYEFPDSLEDAAKALDLQLHKTSLQTEAEVAAAFNPAVAEAAWEPEVLTQGLVSPPVEIGEARVVAVKVTQFEAAHIPSLAAIREEVLTVVQAERVREAARTRGEALLKRLDGGETGPDVAAAEKLEWEAVSAAGRADERLNRAVLRAAFRLGSVASGAPARTGVELADGAYAVVEVSKVDAPAEAKATEALAAAARDALVRNRAVSAWRDFMSEIRQTASVSTHPESL